MAVAMTRLANEGPVLGGDLLFAGVMGEELGSVGSRHLVASGLRASAVVVGEPTGLDVILGHRGVFHLNVKIHGVSAHASNPDAGVNPSLKMARLLLDLEPYVAEVRTRMDPVLGKAALTPTIMATSSGSAATIPDSCTVTFQQELLPSETAERATEEFRREVERICLAHDISATVSSQPRRSPCLIEPEAEIVQIAGRAAAKARDVCPRLAGYTAATDSYVFMGVGMPTVAIGPGNEHGCGVHGIDEFVEIDQLLQSVEVYMEIACSYLT